jgi:cell division protein FtsI (penicillin-binding protein 3)
MVTPLQIARAYAAIANHGLLPPVSFRALDAPPNYSRAISPEIASDLMAMLEVVVSDQGTAQRASIPGYSVAGKTGTARIHESGGYSNDRYRAFFVGIAPASAPRFVAVVVINDPRGAEYYGGDVAAPVFAAVVGKALRMYGVAPDALPEQGSMLISRAEAER